MEEKAGLTTIHRAQDIANMSDPEKKHVPMIHIDGQPGPDSPVDVTVWVGEELAHPNEAGHHIEFIDLYLDDMFLCRCDLTWGYTYPKVCFNVLIERSGRLRAFERCNLHGDWTNSMEVSV